jgi:hypothetical protein
MNDKPKHHECVRTLILDKQVGEFLVELIDAANNPDLSLEQRSFAMMQAGAILFGPDSSKGH